MTLLVFLALLPGCSRPAPVTSEADPSTPDPSGGTGPSDPPDSGTPGGTGDATGLALTEVVDHATSANVKFVEITNLGANDVSLAGLALTRYSNGGTEGVDIPLPSEVLSAGASFVVANLDGQADFVGLYGMEPDLSSDECNGNGNDAWALTSAGAVLDVFGEIGVDGLGTAWEYTDSVASRVGGAATTTWTATDWVIREGADTASPGTYDGAAPTTEPGTTPPPTTVVASIPDLRQGTVALETPVSVTGTLTAIAPFGLFIEDGSGAAWSGIWAYTGAGWNDEVGAEIGDQLLLTGTLIDFNGLTEIETEDPVTDAVVVLGHGAPLAPTPTTLATLLADPEPWESMLLSISGVEVASLPAAYGEWSISDAGDPGLSLIVDDLIYAPADLSVDAPLSAIVGPLYYSFGNHKLAPRNAADLVE